MYPAPRAPLGWALDTLTGYTVTQDTARAWPFRATPLPVYVVRVAQFSTARVPLRGTSRANTDTASSYYIGDPLAH